MQSQYEAPEAVVQQLANSVSQRTVAAADLFSS